MGQRSDLLSAPPRSRASVTVTMDQGLATGAASAKMCLTSFSPPAPAFPPGHALNHGRHPFIAINYRGAEEGSPLVSCRSPFPPRAGQVSSALVLLVTSHVIATYHHPNLCIINTCLARFYLPVISCSSSSSLPELILLYVFVLLTSSPLHKTLLCGGASRFVSD